MRNVELKRKITFLNKESEFLKRVTQNCTCKFFGEVLKELIKKINFSF